jgi:hypothetical protein
MSTVLVRWLFLRLLGLVYLIAFVSFWSQAQALIGSDGILPIAAHLEFHDSGELERFFRLPTLFWLTTSDALLHGVCFAGVSLSLLLLLRIAPGACLIGLWALYLSLVHVGQVFLAYQWDFLLLEAGFVAIFFAPWTGAPRLEREAEPSRWALWVLRVLCVRLVFSSGVLKLLNRKGPWHDLTALDFHFETQPLPTWTAWLAHQLPHSVLAFGVVLTLVLQTAVPLLGLGPRRARLIAFIGITGHQLLIAATGNFTYFNLLALALALTLLDDGFVARVLPTRLVARAAATPRSALGTERRLIAAVCVALLSLHAVQMTRTLGKAGWLPRAVNKVYGRAHKFGTISGYGLFVSMTTERPEIILEGSHDGVTWLPYELPYKPGRLDRRPGFVAPLQPRLDWQLWFAALGDVQWEPWLITTMHHLSKGTPSVLRLFAHDPFPDAPPRYVRAAYYDYRFTSPAELRATGRWWKRTWLRLYAEPIDGGAR